MAHRYEMPHYPTPRQPRRRPSTAGTVLVVLLIGSLLSIILYLLTSA